jgi:hypothetical protein
MRAILGHTAPFPRRGGQLISKYDYINFDDLRTSSSDRDHVGDGDGGAAHRMMGGCIETHTLEKTRHKLPLFWYAARQI